MIKYSALVGLALLPTGCPLLDVETQVQEACLTYKNVMVDPAPAGQTDVHQMFAFDDLGPVHSLLSLDDGATVHFVSAKTTAVSGITDFSFVQAADVSMSSETLPVLVVYNCSGDCVSADDTLSIPTSVQDNALDYLKGDSIMVDMSFTGQMPTTAWSMNVDMCFDAQAGYTVDP